MRIKMSEGFWGAAKKAALALSHQNPKIYLKEPFSGFYVTFDPPEECFDSFESEGRRIFVICESFFGKQA